MSKVGKLPELSATSDRFDGGEREKLSEVSTTLDRFNGRKRKAVRIKRNFGQV
ncbi:hypothetical protein [Mesobacillus jeotgali]|uniref:hypothetical protein n=1 Tax=Mesobacillus jeotgali TaxID=129985 RepID=UPI001CFCE027|nr:hypothetical protein [Mesobacillus jeotgali]